MQFQDQDMLANLGSVTLVHRKSSLSNFCGIDPSKYRAIDVSSVLVSSVRRKNHKCRYCGSEFRSLCSSTWLMSSECSCGLVCRF